MVPIIDKAGKVLLNVPSDTLVGVNLSGKKLERASLGRRRSLWRGSQRHRSPQRRSPRRESDQGHDQRGLPGRRAAFGRTILEG